LWQFEYGCTTGIQGPNFIDKSLSITQTFNNIDNFIDKSMNIITNFFIDNANY